MRIILFQPVNSPNFCFEVMPVNSRGKLYADTKHNRKLGRLRSVFIQSDWEYAGLARTFGFSLSQVQYPSRSCPHDATDGTVDCKECGVKVGDFLASAYDYLADNTGKIVDDPGYLK